MDPRAQLVLGFDLMRAAIEGGHDLDAAWAEAMDISARSAQPTPYVYGGALACLMFCASALEEVGQLADVDVPGHFEQPLPFGHAARKTAVDAALDANDHAEIIRLAKALIFAIKPERHRLQLGGRFEKSRNL